MRIRAAPTCTLPVVPVRAEYASPHCVRITDELIQTSTAHQRWRDRVLGLALGFLYGLSQWHGPRPRVTLRDVDGACRRDGWAWTLPASEGETDVNRHPDIKQTDATAVSRHERRQSPRGGVHGEPARVHLRALVLGTYAEMPGLSLTLPQAARLFGLREVTCRCVLGDLVRESRLRQSADGQYRAASSGNW